LFVTFLCEVVKKVLKFVHCKIFTLSWYNIPSSPISHYFYTQSRQVYYVDHIHVSIFPSHNLGHTYFMFFHLYTLSMVVIPVKFSYHDTPFLGLITVSHLVVSWVHMAAGDFSCAQQTVKLSWLIHHISFNYYIVFFYMYLFMLVDLNITSVAEV
jgi:hypothetical protein